MKLNTRIDKKLFFNILFLNINILLILFYSYDFFSKHHVSGNPNLFFIIFIVLSNFISIFFFKVDFFIPIKIIFYDVFSFSIAFILYMVFLSQKIITVKDLDVILILPFVGFIFMKLYYVIIYLIFIYLLILFIENKK